MKSAVVMGTGSALPGPPITNELLRTVFGPGVSRLADAVGIRARHYAVDPANGWTRTGVLTSHLAAQAATQALASASVAPSEVDLLVLVTSTPDYPFPATATLVQEHLGIQRCIAIELRAACAGVAQAIVLAERLMRCGDATTAVVIGAELSSSFLDFRHAHQASFDDSTLISAAMFGDGAGAVLLRARDAGADGPGIFYSRCVSVGCGEIPGFVAEVGGAKLPPWEASELERRRVPYHDFKAILRKGPELVLQAFSEFQEATNVSLADISLVIPPQANIALTARTLVQNGIDASKVFVNGDQVGNTSSASVLLALDHAVRAEKVKPGETLVLLAAEASKWLCGAVAMRWGQ